jgi:hypothetical protein
VPSDPPPANDDLLTLISIAILVYILGDVVHEGLGHGFTAWLSGAHHLTISTVALQSDIETRWISAAGTLANLFFAAIFWLLLRNPRRYRPATSYFLLLAMAGNLFGGTGYFFFSGVANFGDWAGVIRGLHPYWLWRLGLVLVGGISYYASMLLVAHKLRFFQSGARPGKRIRSLCWTPYFAEAVLAGIAALPNPAGLFYVIASALPSTLGANAGLLSIPSMMPRPTPAAAATGTLSLEPIGPIPHSLPWIISATVAGLLFIFVLGRGLTWNPR